MYTSLRAESHQSLLDKSGKRKVCHDLSRKGQSDTACRLHVMDYILSHVSNLASHSG